MAVEFTLERVYPAPPDIVFAAHLDIDRFHTWMPGCQGIEKLTDGPPAPGTRWRETRKVGRFTATEEFAITRLEAPTALSLYVDGKKGTNGRGEYFFDYTFEPTADHGTRVRLRGRIDMGSPIPNLFMRLFKGMFIKQTARDMAALDAHIAARPAAG